MNETAVRPEMSAKQRWVAKYVRLPRLSGKASAAWLVLFFVLTGVLIPMSLALPQWIEFEIVLVSWWLLWFGVLARFLFTGQRVTDDHQMREPRKWFAFAKANQEPKKKDPDRA